MVASLDEQAGAAFAERSMSYRPRYTHVCPSTLACGSLTVQGKESTTFGMGRDHSLGLVFGPPEGSRLWRITCSEKHRAVGHQKLYIFKLHERSRPCEVLALRSSQETWGSSAKAMTTASEQCPKPQHRPFEWVAPLPASIGLLVKPT